MKERAGSQPRAPRGIYAIDPDGPAGEVVLFVVNSAGKRIHVTEPLFPAEVAEMTAALRTWLEKVDPVDARTRLEHARRMLEDAHRLRDRTMNRPTVTPCDTPRETALRDSAPTWLSSNPWTTAMTYNRHHRRRLFVMTVDVPAAGIRAGDVLWLSPSRSYASVRRDQPSTMLRRQVSRDHFDKVVAAMLGGGAEYLWADWPSADAVRQAIRGLNASRRYLGSKTPSPLVVLQPINAESVSTPIEAGSDDAAIFELFYQVGRAVPVSDEKRTSGKER